MVIVMLKIILILLFVLVVVIFCILGLIKYFTDKDKEKQEVLEKGQKYNSIFSEKMNHVCGLPLAEESECLIHLCKEQIVIEKDSNVFKLKNSRIIDMNIKTSKEVQNSISNAVGGAMLLGPIGAFIGGTSTELHRFLIIIYKDKDNKEICISFDMKDDLKKYGNTYRYVESIKKINVEQKEINL